MLSDQELLIVATVPILADADRRAAILARSHVRSLAAGEPVVVEGDEPGAFYVVIAGQLEVSVAGVTGPKVLGTLRAGDWFGEEAALRALPRSATVRSLELTRCIEVPRDVFEHHVLGDPRAHRTLVEHAEVRLAERSLRSIAFFADLDPDEEIAGNVWRRPFAAGDTLFAAGTAADTMGFVLEGVAVIEPGIRLGPAQCIGEQDVLAGRAVRSERVVAETAGVLLEVRAARFCAWVARDGELADWVGTLQHIYRLAGGRLLSVYEAMVDGHRCAVTVHGDPSTDGVTTTDRIGADHLVIARCRRGAIEETVRWQDGATIRELGIAGAVRNSRGELRGGELVQIVVERTGPDVGILYRRIATGEPITARDLARFRRSGHLGGTAKASERELLCQCLQIAACDVVSCESAGEISRETGAGLVCGGCRPAIERLVSLRARPAQAVARAPVAASTCAIPEVRAKTFAFARQPLAQIRAVPEVMLIAVTSLLSTPAERLIIATLGEAAPQISDPALASAIEAFLEQESNHIAAHAPLNRMLVEEIYPYADRLRRLGDQMLARFRGLPLQERLAVAAGYEFASDCIFGAVYETHYREGRRFHRDPAVHEAMVSSGVGPLFSWHALEELGHRHVAFEAALALGVTRRQLRRGMLRVITDLARLQFPALLQLLRHEPKASLLGFVGAVFVDPGFVRTFAVGLGRFLRTDFDPGAEHYDFVDQLARDVDHHEEP